MIDKKIFWIASYPKSGNTWVRAILSSLFFTEDGNFNFNYFKYIPLFEKSSQFNFVRNINKNDHKILSDFKILSKYWLKAQENLKIEEDFIFVKVHHACMKYFDNFFTTPDHSRGLIHIVRDPRDIAISYSHHRGCKIDDTINLMQNGGFYPYVNQPPNQLQGYLFPWDQHVESWNRLQVPHLVIKYEDLLGDTKKSIFKIINFFKNNFKFKFKNLENKIDNIIITTSFKELQNRENVTNFDEAPKNKTFFRKGEKNQWKSILNQKQLNKIERSFEIQMKKFNYID